MTTREPDVSLVGGLHEKNRQLKRWGSAVKRLTAGRKRECYASVCAKPTTVR